MKQRWTTFSQCDLKQIFRDKFKLLLLSLPFGQRRKLSRLVKLDAFLHKAMEVITQCLVISKVFAN